VPRRDDRTEGVAEERETVQAERFGEQVDVVREAVEAQRRWVDAIASALSPLVDVEQPELVREWVEPGRHVGVVEAWPAVQDDHREAFAHLVDEERDAVWKLDMHA